MSAEQEILHENTLYAEPIFHLGSFTVSNSLLNSWLVVLVVLVLGILIRKKIKLVPRGIQNAFEIIFEGFLSIFDGVTGDRKRSMKFAPLVLAFFFFILLNNWLGLLPGVGSIGQVISENGELIFVPYLCLQ